MPAEYCMILASFAAPENIGTTPLSMVWMFPLLASIAIIYKTTKLRAMTWKTAAKEFLTLFGFLSGFMVLAIIVLNLVVWLLTN